MTTAELKIERKTLIQAPRSRVWRALTSGKEFGEWFSAKLDADFEPGKRVNMISTGHSCSGQAFYAIVERMEPEHTFSWRWHPGSAQEGQDGGTVVEFHLEETSEGTLVTVTETGFDQISLERRAKAFEENSHGWEIQLGALQRYAGRAA